MTLWGGGVPQSFGGPQEYFCCIFKAYCFVLACLLMEAILFEQLLGSATGFFFQPKYIMCYFIK